MKTNGITRILLGLLVVVGIGFIAKIFWGKSSRNGVVFEKLEQGRFYEKHFAVNKPLAVNIDAVGSFENQGVLATYAWILRDSDRAVLWQMKPDNVRKERNSLAHAVAKLNLEKGKYTVYFTTLGDKDVPNDQTQSFWQKIFGREARTWYGDVDQWYFQLSAADAKEASNVAVLGEMPKEETPHSNAVLWQVELGSGWRNEPFVFKVVHPTTIFVDIVGDIGGDYGEIANGNGDVVWKMTKENSQPAGGGIRNRKFAGNISLPMGVYTATYISDSQHDPRNWVVNPPLDPTKWGMSIKALVPADVKVYDIWQQPKLVDLTKAGDNASLSQTFNLESDANVLVYGLGENTNEWYDYGWITNKETGQTVWTMANKRGEYGGGAEKNQFIQEKIQLLKGTYTAFFKSDDTHSYDDWNEDEPSTPERWGLTVLLMDDTVKFKTEASQHATNAVNVSSDAPYPSLIPNEEVLTNITKVGNSTHEVRTFNLDEPTTELRILCLGEFSGYWGDRGWIINKDTNQLVWDMTIDKTEHAGGTTKNRKFDGNISLPAGEYEVHYQTDSSHAYGNFVYPPSDPEAYGIQIWKIQ